MRRLKRIIVIVFGLLGLYALLGFMVLPMVLEAVLPDKLGEALNRPVRVSQVRFNPFLLRLEVEGFDLRDKNKADPFVSFEALSVDMEWKSLFKKGLVIEGARLEKPSVHLVRLDGKTFTFSDLTGGTSEAADKTKDADAEPFRFAVRNIAINNGSVVFRDLPMKKDHVVSGLQFSLPLISNFTEDAAADVQAKLAAVVNDAKLSADATIRPFGAVFEATVDVGLAGVRTPFYFAYVPKEAVGVDITSGVLDLRGNVHFLNTEKTPALTVQGDVAVADLRLADRSGAPILMLPELKVAVSPSRPLENSIALSSVKLKNPELNFDRSREGVISLATLGPKPADDKEGKNKAADTPNSAESSPARTPSENQAKGPAADRADSGFRLTVGELAIDDGKVAFVDHAAGATDGPQVKEKPVQAPFALSLEGVNVRINDFSLAPGKIARFDVRSRVNQEGEISAAGKFGISPVFAETDFKMANLHLAWAKPYIPSHIHPEIGDGLLSADGKATVKSAEDMQVTVAGNLAVNDLFMAPSGTGSADKKSRAKEKADIRFSGRLESSPLLVEGAVAATDIDLAWAQPYIPENIKLEVKNGLLSADGKVALKSTDKGGVAVKVTGKAAIDDFVSVDSQDQKAFASIKTLAVQGLNITTEPLIIDMESILVKEPKHRFVLLEPGVSNVSKIFTAPSAGAEATPVETKPEKPGEEEPALSVNLGEVVVRNGDFRFLDRTIDPDYSARLNLTELRVAGLDSQRFKSASVKAEGVIDNESPIKINGTINPFAKDLFIDLDCSLSNMELSPLSPYTGKFIGQTIGKGKLTTSVLFKIDQNMLSIQNKVLLDQLTLGRKVDSPAAVDLPIGVAIALLKDRSGKIDINLPVSGRTDDPQFSILKIVWNALRKFLVKAAASPFDLVSGIVTGGESLRYIEFAPGSADLDETADKKLASVATLLFERPTLQMDLTGYVDPEEDRTALAEGRLERELKAMKLKEEGKSRNSRQKPEDITLTPEEYADFVKKLYAEKAGRGRDKSLPIPEMAAWLQSQAPVSDQDLRKLAVQRARKVKDAISRDGRIAGDRLFLNEAGSLTPKKMKDFAMGRVELAIK